MSNKPKYSIGEIVRIKSTGEKVKILGYWNDFSCKPCEKFVDVSFPYIVSSKDGECFGESELKPYRPSRTGKYRNEKGQFMSRKEKYPLWTIKSEVQPFITEDSKQRNYQNMSKLKSPDNYYDKQEWFDQVVIRVNYLIRSMERIEKKIDELGRRV